MIDLSEKALCLPELCCEEDFKLQGKGDEASSTSLSPWQQHLGSEALSDTMAGTKIYSSSTITLQVRSFFLFLVDAHFKNMHKDRERANQAQLQESL